MKKLIALMLVLVMAFAFTAVASADEEAVMSYAEYAAAELDTPVVVEAYVQAHQSWWNDQITLYTQDEDGAYFIYNAACPQDVAEKLVPGTKIRVSGYKSAWSGEVEIVDATFEIIEDAEPWVAEAADVSELLGTEELEARQNEFVAFKGMTVESYSYNAGGETVDTGAAFSYGWDGSGAEGTDADLYFNVSLNGQTYTFTVEYYLCNETTEVYEAVRNLSVGDVVDLEGFLYWYNGANPHITSVKPHEEAAPAGEFTEADLPTEPEFDPNPDYDVYTVVEYTIEDIQADLVCTVSAKADFSEFYQECNFYGDDQMTRTTWDGSEYTVLEDTTGFMAGDTPAILDKAMEQGIWLPIG